MAKDKPKDEKPKEDASAGNASKKGSPVKVAIIVAAVMVIEAVVLLGVSMMTKGHAAEAEEFQEKTEESTEKLVEIEVLADKLPNTKQGAVYLYDTQITVVVKESDAAAVTEELTASKARIKTQIATIWREADPRYFKEPTLETLTKQAEAAIREIIDQGADPENSRIKEVLIPTLTGFRAGY